MTKEEFNNLTVLEQLEHVNSLNAEGMSLRNISVGLTMSKTTIRDRFLKIGYTYNKELKQYCKDMSLETQSHQEIIKVPQKANKQVIEPINKVNTKELQKYDSKEKSKGYDKDILELINKKTEILEMLDYYKNNTNVIEKTQINLSYLPQEMQTKIINKSIKVYEEVYQSFDKVCSQFSGIKKQDIISLALYEFCEKYKK